MKTSQKGFTLIELVVVIVLLGILGVTALGKFQDLSVDAQSAANQGIASEISSSSAINYAARILDASAGIAVANATTCASLVGASGLLATALDLSSFTIGSGANCTAAGETKVCTVAESPSIGATQGTASVICTE